MLFTSVLLITLAYSSAQNRLLSPSTIYYNDDGDEISSRVSSKTSTPLTTPTLSFSQNPFPESETLTLELSALIPEEITMSESERILLQYHERMQRLSHVKKQSHYLAFQELFRNGFLKKEELIFPPKVEMTRGVAHPLAWQKFEREFEKWERNLSSVAKKYIQSFNVGKYGSMSMMVDEKKVVMCKYVYGSGEIVSLQYVLSRLYIDA